MMEQKYSWYCFNLLSKTKHFSRNELSIQEKQAPCKEPDAGLDPRHPGSHPGLKAALNR